MLGWKDVSDYPFGVVTLFEPIQVEWLLKWKNQEQLSVLLKEYPEITWHIKMKLPESTEKIEELKNLETNLKYSKKLERDFVSSLEDWIIYVTDPDAYDKQSHNNWNTEELLSLIDFKEKTVVDIGSGTGSQVFRVAPLAKTVYAVEPIGHLRNYLKKKSKTLGYHNVFCVDGLMTDIPFPDHFCDVVMSGHVFGDYIIEEYEEMNRVVKAGGMIILIPGNNDEDNDIHKFLMDKGFYYGVFEEPGDGMKRKYWKIK
ncbi:MAG: class I SAM-dependent methyltransferase [Candidatus Izemoplasmatales bacterium]